LYILLNKQVISLKVGEIYKEEYHKDVDETKIAHRLLRIIGYDKYQVF